MSRCTRERIPVPAKRKNTLIPPHPTAFRRIPSAFANLTVGDDAHAPPTKPRQSSKGPHALICRGEGAGGCVKSHRRACVLQGYGVLLLGHLLMVKDRCRRVLEFSSKSSSYFFASQMKEGVIFVCVKCCQCCAQQRVGVPSMELRRFEASVD